jgi:hypothetical protein
MKELTYMKKYSEGDYERYIYIYIYIIVFCKMFIGLLCASYSSLVKATSARQPP